MTLKELAETPPWEWPEDAGRTLRQTLTNKQAETSDRVIAAELAGDLVVMDDKVASDLLKIVGAAGEPEELRGKAAIAFGAVLEQADLEGFDDPMDLDDVPIEESTFEKIKETLRTLYADESVPKYVRRRILEASVRAEADWHRDAIAKAYASGDRDWLLTAVFASRWVKGFNKQILDALKSTDSEIHYEAVHAAGSWELQPAAPHILGLVLDPKTPKPLMLAAIEAIGSIRPKDARKNLGRLRHSKDQDIAEAADEAITMAEGAAAFEETGGDGGNWIN
jgi:hypothetical protein